MKGPLFGFVPQAAGKSHAVWHEIAPELVPADFRSPYDMDVSFLRLLSRARRRAGVAFRVISDYRDPERNEAAGGAQKSAHLERPCRAVDLQVRDNYERAMIVMAAVEEGFLRIGVYPAHEDGGGSLHLDASEANPAPRMWTHV